MADSTLPNLVAVTTPAATDIFGCRQSGDTRDKKQTRAQLHTLQSGEKLTLPADNNAANPTLNFGGDSGFYETSDNNLGISFATVARWFWSSGSFGSATAGGASLRREAASATVPAHTFNGDLITGVGRRTATVGVLIGGAQNCMEFGGVGSVPQVGFYGTAAIAKQTGVAVTAAGIHAALVSLGIIAA